MVPTQGRLGGGEVSCQMPWWWLTRQGELEVRNSGEWKQHSEPCGGDGRGQRLRMTEEQLLFCFLKFNLFWAVLGLHCCLGFSLVAAPRLLTAVTSIVADRGL